MADVNPKLEKRATKPENTVAIAIRPKSLGVSNLAKIAKISTCISSWAICEVADQPMLRTVLVFRFILIRGRKLLPRFSHRVIRSAFDSFLLLEQTHDLTSY